MLVSIKWFEHHTATMFVLRRTTTCIQRNGELAKNQPHSAVSHPWGPATVVGSYLTRRVIQGGASILLFGLSLQPERFTASDVPGRSQGSVATVSKETRLSRAEHRDKTSTSSPGSPSGEYRGSAITHFFRQSEIKQCRKYGIYIDVLSRWLNFLQLWVKIVFDYSETIVNILLIFVE